MQDVCRSNAKYCGQRTSSTLHIIALCVRELTHSMVCSDWVTSVVSVCVCCHIKVLFQ